ncbi:MAG TPA: hypothetical protein VMW38_25015 [Terriglobia bacterium]|nr:hypothetical protein [Terriglobia bacterium]
MSKDSNLAFLDWWEKDGCKHARTSFDDAILIWDAALDWSRPKALEKIKALREQLKAIEQSGVKEEPKKAAPKKETKRFIPPTLEELISYMESQEFANAKETAQAFIDHYEARGWKPKGYTVQMTSWKAAVRTWKHSPFGNGNGNGNGSTKKLGGEW